MHHMRQDEDGKGPEHFNDTGEKEYVEENDEKGGDGEEEDAAAIVHPTVDRVINVPDIRSNDIEDFNSTSPFLCKYIFNFSVTIARNEQDANCQTTILHQLIIHWTLHNSLVCIEVWHKFLDYDLAINFLKFVFVRPLCYILSFSIFLFFNFFLQMCHSLFSLRF